MRILWNRSIISVIILPILSFGLIICPASAELNASQKQQVAAAVKPQQGQPPAACKEKAEEATLEDLQNCRKAIKAKVTAKGPNGQDLDADIDQDLKATVPHFKGVKLAAKTEAVVKLKYTDLTASITSNNAPAVRKEAAGVMGIADNSHGNHGANFNQTQTVKQIIKDVFSQVKDPNQKNTVAQKVIAAYKFDPRL